MTVGTSSALAAALARLPPGWVPLRCWPDRSSLVVEAHPPAEDHGPDLVAAVIGPDGVALRCGVDPRLPALARELARPGARLLGHRAGRRGVLRVGGPDGLGYVKVVRPGRAARVADSARATARALGRLPPTAPVALPRIRRVDDGAGVVDFAALPGSTLAELLDRGDPVAPRVAGRVGRLLDALASSSADGLPVHTTLDEATILERWVDQAHHWTGLDAGPVAPSVLARLRALPDRPPVPCHRDLHDQQILEVRDGLGLLDTDTFCAADPALDRANLLAHLHLRGILTGPTGAAVARWSRHALHPEGCSPAGADDPALPVLLAAALVRVAAVHSFRPGPPGLADRLLVLAARALEGHESS